jgi:RepB DNA-primase from phage plasmid
MDFNDPCLADEGTVRQFIRIISQHAARAINGGGSTGVLQLYRVNPLDENNTVPSRFRLDDVEQMVQTALNDAAAGHNVYIEARTVSLSVNGKKRGTEKDTVWVLGLVVDSDADKNMAGNVTAKPSLVVETSRGNYHLWYLFDQAISAARGREIGKAMRESAGADHDTGVVTQGYRVAGTPNFPSTSKRTRGRTTVEPTRIVEYAGCLWKPDELLAAFPPPEQEANHGTTADESDDATLPHELFEIIRYGAGAGDRSAVFHSVIAQLKRRRWCVDAIVALFDKYPNGIAQKYFGRLREEVQRSYDKFANNAATIGSAANTGTGGATATFAAAPRVLRTIHIVASQLPRMLAETEQALLATGMPIFSRAGTLVHPVVETIPAADDCKTTVARLRSFCVDSLIEWIADAALFRRFDAKRNQWVDNNPPRQVVASLLAREGRWTIPRVSGIITTPTLRTDGSLLTEPGYDARSELYLLPGFGLLTIAEHPTREQAMAALNLLTNLLSEFSFVDKIDSAVALSGLLTALVRGSLATAPMYLIRAHTAGTGKSYLVDVIAMVATGRLCPVITAGKTEEETEKRLGSVLLDGSSIVSLDNCAHELDGQLLCQLTERPLIKIRILGRSEMPECECHTTVFATGNNVSFKGDMVRRGLTCNLDAKTERPELRSFEQDPLRQVMSERKNYVAAALTIIRAYLAAGSPAVCGSIGSYSGWSTMVRSPLVWLGQTDPVASMESSREDDPELADIRELFTLWADYLDLDEKYTTGRIIEIACQPLSPNDFNRQPFKELLLRIAGDRQGSVVSKSLGWWLRKISGRVVDSHRLEAGRINKALACYCLSKV